MTTPVFPAELPMVSAFGMQPNAQVLAPSEGSSPMSFRRTSRVPSAEVDVSWRLFGPDMAVFRDFWKTDLLRGHKWFSLILPCSGGYYPHIVRFKEEDYSANLSGHDFWTVTATLEVRERIFGPPVPPPLLPQIRFDVIAALHSHVFPSSGKLVDSLLPGVMYTVGIEIATYTAWTAYPSPPYTQAGTWISDLGITPVSGGSTVFVGASGGYATPAAAFAAFSAVGVVLDGNLDYYFHLNDAAFGDNDASCGGLSVVLTPIP